MKHGRVAFALGVSTAMVVLIVLLVPRAYVANDDIALTEMLRKNVFTPWISPVLARALGSAYVVAPDVAWYGLFLYAMIIATGAVLIHTCSELVERPAGLGGLATWIGAIMIGANHVVLAISVTWTTVAISAAGTAVAAFVVHAQHCHASGLPMSRIRALSYGLVMTGGFALRADGAAAAGVALLPMLGWALLRGLRTRYRPRPGAVVAMLAPILLVTTLSHVLPAARGGETRDYAEFNLARGRLSDQTAFAALDDRAPEVLAEAGWSIEDYRDFVRWLIIDERDFPVEKIDRLFHTGGAPVPITWPWAKSELTQIASHSAPSVALFVTLIVLGVILASLATIRRWRGLAFFLGYGVLLTALPVWMSAHQRFPQRISLPIYSVAALGVFVYLARQVADRATDRARRPADDVRAVLALAVVAVFVYGWARRVETWFGQVSWYSPEVEAFDKRVAERKGWVFVYIQSGLMDFDPLRARPRGYEGLHGGWATFSAPWYDSIAELGVHRGADVLGAMIDKPDVYIVTPLNSRPVLEAWIQRKVHDPRVRLAFVDSAAQITIGRPALFRVVTRPMVPGDDEWQAMQRAEWQINDAFPGPPDVSGLAFRARTFAPPYAQHAARLGATPAVVTPVAGGLRCMNTEETPTRCSLTDRDAREVGIHLPVHGLRAARFELALIAPENIVSVHVNALTSTSRTSRWRWTLAPEAQELGFSGSFTLVPGYPAHHLELVTNNARTQDVRELEIFVMLKPGTHAGFELRHLETAEP